MGNGQWAMGEELRMGGSDGAYESRMMRRRGGEWARACGGVEAVAGNGGDR